MDIEEVIVDADGYETVATPAKFADRRYRSKDEGMTFKIYSRKMISTDPEIIEFVVYAPNVSRHCKAGQFVIVRASESSERIPLTIADYDRSLETITLVCQSVGRSSKIINQLTESFLDVVGPLGHPSEVSSAMGNVVLVAGGVGVAPVYPIARAIKELEGNHVINIFGARRKDLIFWEEKMRSVSDEAFVTTDDGSYGIHGFGTTVLKQLIEERGKEYFSTVYAIGPFPMMRAVAELTREYGIHTVVSLNTIMIDGTGMCGMCKVHLSTGETKFACNDGPEFDAHQVDWENLRARMGSYRSEECAEMKKPLIKPAPKRIMNTSKVQTPMPVQPAEFRRSNWDEVALGYTEDMARSEAARCLQCPNPQCVRGCPVNVPIPQFIKEVREGNFLKAYQIIKTAHPCPAMTGRVCAQENQCQCADGNAGCILSRANKEPVAIGRLERFVADYVRNNNLEKEALEGHNKIELSGLKVAIIGTGPAGIAAAGECAKKGHKVTMFEALHSPGGVCLYGIPEFRLPKKIVQHEIDGLKNLGLVDIKCNYVVGKSITIDDLRNEGYSAFFIGSGAGLPRFMGIPGEDYPGVYSANEYLTRCNLMKSYLYPAKYDTPIIHSKKVIVVGGGNVAMDVARCAIRNGAEVTIVYRRRKEDAPARREELEHALEEGVVFMGLNAPLEIVSNCEGTGIKGLRTQCNTYENGSIIPIEGETNFIPCDAIVIAVGTSPNTLIPSTTPGLEITKRGQIVADDSQKTSLDGVYAGGDAQTGAATVIKALGAGKTAGIAINNYLENEKDKLLKDPELKGKIYVPDIFMESEADVVEQPATKV